MTEEKVEIFCSECYEVRTMTVASVLRTPKGNWRVEADCDSCHQKYSFNRREGFLNKIYKVTA